MKLSTWKKGDMVRVYINDLIGQGYGDKVWVEQQDEDALGDDWTVKVRLLEKTHLNLELKDRAYALIDEISGGKKIKFAEIVEIGEKKQRRDGRSS